MPTQIGAQPELLQDVSHAHTAFRRRCLRRRTLRPLRHTVEHDDVPARRGRSCSTRRARRLAGRSSRSSPRLLALGIHDYRLPAGFVPCGGPTLDGSTTGNRTATRTRTRCRRRAITVPGIWSSSLAVASAAVRLGGVMCRRIVGRVAPRNVSRPDQDRRAGRRPPRILRQRDAPEEEIRIRRLLWCGRRCGWGIGARGDGDRQQQ